MSLEPKAGDVHGKNLKTRRKNTTKACEECRRRRAKCDGKQPTCSRCIDRSLECHYSAHEDGRRPAPKSYVDMLRNRIRTLERVLEANNIDIEASVAQLSIQDDGRPGTTSQAQQSLDSRLIPDFSTTPALEEALLNFEGSLPVNDAIDFTPDDESRQLSQGDGGGQFQPSMTPDDEPDDPFIHGVPSPTKPGFSQFRLRVDRLLVQDISFSQEITPELENDLIDLYFKWEQPWCQVVNEKLFRENRTTNGRFSSPLLLNCILAAGSRFTDRPEVRTSPDDPNTAGQMFMETAEKLLYYELKWPSLTTIQSASILGTLYQATGADAAGWLHHGIATRLAVDMGLNMDASRLLESNLMSVEEAELRNQIYWALYCVDKLLASYIGRVCTMLDSQGQVPMPKRPELTTESTRGKARIGRPPVFTDDQIRTSLHISMMSLCSILEKILVALYAPSHATRQVRRGSFIRSCLLELKGWYYDLPAELKLDRKGVINRLPQAYTMHLVYHTAYIHIMKPFMLKPPVSKDASPGCEDPAEVIAQEAVTTCYRSAVAICDVAKKYQHTFGSFRNSQLTASHCILSAALILLQTKPLALDAKGGTVDSANIDLCLKVLEELSSAWSLARSMRRNLVKLCNQDIAQENAKHKPLRLSLDNRNDTGAQLGRFSHAESSTQALATNTFVPDFVPGNNDSVWNPEWLDIMMENAEFPEVGLDFMSQALPADYTNFDNLNRYH